MKVLHLIPSFDSGGAERQLSIIAPALAKSGIECHIGYCYEGPNLQPLFESAVHLHQFRIGGNHDPRLFWQIFSLIRSVRPDVIQTWLLQMDVMGGAAALLAKVPFILSERSSASAYPPGWKTFFRGRIGRFASSIVANSQGGLDYWKSLRIKAPICLIRNCVTSVEHASVVTGKITPTTPLILFAGRLSPEKNVMHLLDALIRVMNAAPEYVAIIFGEGPMRDDLKQKISGAKMSEQIRLGGYTENLAGWLNRANLCVSISDFEGNPNVVLEAAAQGCPLLLSDIPAHREIFDESSVRFVQHKSLDAVSDGILKALHEANNCIVKAARAKRLVASPTIDSILNSYIAVYSHAIRFKKMRLSES